MTVSKPDKTLRFYWVRHAPPLNPNGLVYGADMAVDLSDWFALAAQAQRIPQHAKWHTSCYQRAIDTAQAISAFKRPLPAPEQRAGMNEQSFGQWAGKTRAEVAKDPLFARYLEHPASIRPPGGEHLNDFSSRVRDDIIDLLRRPRTAQAGVQADAQLDAYVVVAHAGTIRAALGMAIGWSMAKAIRIPVDPLSLTVIDYNDDYRRATGNPWAVRGINIAP